MKREVKTAITALVVLSILSALNLAWKFSISDFPDMSSGRKLNVVASTVLIAVNCFTVCVLMYLTKKNKT
jgi:hypothetical protein